MKESSYPSTPLECWGANEVNKTSEQNEEMPWETNDPGNHQAHQLRSIDCFVEDI